MTKAAVRVVAKALACALAKVVVVQSKRPFKNKSSVALQHGHAGALAMTRTAFGVTSVPRPQTKVRSTPYLPYARLCWQARVGSCEGSRVGCTSEWRGLLYLFIFNILALIATTMVLTVIKTAPAAGLNTIPCLYKTPAANGSAITL